MSNVIISVENLSKQYRLGTVGSGTLQADIASWWHRVRGKEDPYLKLGGINTRHTKGTSDYVWALKDINFDVTQGEVLGIIGKNGAGKSTLLKLLSRVTAPTTGTIKAKGRIASLLEVGTGFHPELTGKENIYLNGSIMGMKRVEITRKLDEIIDFAGVEQYIDTPVKRYSSGMYVRLAFAVAAHLEPEILIVDEVLAVGDAEFQQKAIGKMQDVAQGQGRTVLFVSHNMKAVSSMCTRSLLLCNGTLAFSGGTPEAIERYLTEEVGTDDVLAYHTTNSENTVKGVSMISAKIEASEIIRTTSSIPVEVKLRFSQDNPIFHLNLHLKTRDDIHLLQSSSDPITAAAGDIYTFHFTIPANLLNENKYVLNFSFVTNLSTVIHIARNVLRFSITEAPQNNNLKWYGKTPGLLIKKLETRTELSSRNSS